MSPTPPHPVHTGELRSSVRNCRGCDHLDWEHTRGYRRRICVLAGRIPGNIACPIHEQNGVEQA
jgi:hypothetical protein